MKDKNQMIISIDGEKLRDKIQHLFMIKTLNRVGIEKMQLNIIETIYDNPAANILNGKKLKAFSSKNRNKTRMPTLALSFNIVLEVLAIVIQQKKNKNKNKNKIKKGKERKKKRRKERERGEHIN